MAVALVPWSAGEEHASSHGEPEGVLSQIVTALKGIEIGVAGEPEAMGVVSLAD